MNLPYSQYPLTGYDPYYRYDPYYGSYDQSPSISYGLNKSSIPFSSFGQSSVPSGGGFPFFGMPQTPSGNPMIDYYGNLTQNMEQMQQVYDAQQKYIQTQTAYLNSIYTSRVTSAQAMNQAQNDLLKAGTDAAKAGAEATTAAIDTMKSMKESAMKMAPKAPTGGGGG